MDISPQGYTYGSDPQPTIPFWQVGGSEQTYVEFLRTSKMNVIKDNIQCTNYIINYLSHNSDEEETFNIYVPGFDVYYTKSEIDNKNFLTSSSLNDYYTKTEIDNKNYLVQSDLDNYYTKSEIDNKNYLVQSDLDNYYTKSYIQSHYYDRTTTINLINSIVDQKLGGVINGQY